MPITILSSMARMRISVGSRSDGEYQDSFFDVSVGDGWMGMMRNEGG